MENFEFISPTQFIFGKDAQHDVGAWIADHGYQRVLVIYGQGHVVKSGLLDQVKTSLAANNLEVFEVSGVRPNPEITSVREAARIAKAEKCDFVLAIGGGSVIDCAKASATAATYDGDAWDLYQRPNPVVHTQALDLGVVLTIPAAGSEASASSVISNDELGAKTSMAGDFIRPKVAWMNPELTYSLPAWQTAAGITDMFAHIFERFFSATYNTAVTDSIALGLLSSIRSEAIKVMRSPNNYDARANIMWASSLAHNNLAGVGRDSDWTSHALEHEMSAVKPEVTHGAGLAVIMPAWMRYVCDANPERFRQFGQAIFGLMPTDCALADAHNAIDTLQEFFVSMGMPRYLDDFGFTSDDVETMVKNLYIVKGERFGSFKQITPEDARTIYESAFKH